MSQAAGSIAREGWAVLQAAGVAQPDLDAEILLAHVLGVTRARLHAHPEDSVDAAGAAGYRALLERRARREPLQYLTGIQEFWSLAFKVSPAVLIPRPETEGIVDAFIGLNRVPRPVVLDLGTGSGCIAVAVATECPGARVLACDLSAEALGLARANALAHGAGGRIELLQGDLFEPFRGHGLERGVDFVLANPPYLTEDELRRSEPEVREHEPVAALVAGPDGLLVLRRLLAEAPGFLRPGGHLIVEIGSGQEASARALCTGTPGLTFVEVRRDLAGHPRILIARAA